MKKLEEKAVLLFETKLTLEEVNQNFADVDLYEGLDAALSEALGYEKRRGSDD